MTDRFIHAGAQTPDLIGDPVEEVLAARTGAAFILLPWRGILSVRGKDAVRFLQGMLTQEIAGMAPGEVRPACQVDRKGHLIVDLLVRRIEDGALLEVQSDRIEIVRSTLERYVIMEEVRVTPLPTRATLLCGPGSAGVLRETGLDGWPAHDTAGPDFHIMTDTPRESLDPRLRAAGAVPIGGRTLNRLRIEAGRPWFGLDMDERNFPMEMNLSDAISYTKGCYIGQETVARAHYLGHMNRGLYGVRVPTPTRPPSCGDEVRFEGSLLGALTSVAPPPDPLHGDSLALLLVPSAHQVEGRPVDLSTGGGFLESLPFSEARHAS